MTCEDYQYACAGLHLKSEFRLPGYARLDTSFSPSETGSDVEIAIKPSLSELRTTELSGPNWQANSRELLLSIPSVCKIHIADGKNITIACHNDDGAKDHAAFVAKALAIALLQRGGAALHATAVEVNGRAVLFCAPAPVGKSTLAALLSEHGHRPLAEGFCALKIGSQGEVMAVPDGRRLQLWDDGIAKLKLTAQAGDRVRAGLNKRHLQIESAPGQPIEVAAIYFLSRSGADVAGTITPLNVLDGPKHLLANACVPRLTSLYGSQKFYLICAAALLHRQALFKIEHTRNMSELGAIVSSLENHWEDRQVFS